jgi:hypothetical protein
MTSSAPRRPRLIILSSLTLLILGAVACGEEFIGPDLPVKATTSTPVGFGSLFFPDIPDNIMVDPLGSITAQQAPAQQHGKAVAVDTTDIGLAQPTISKNEPKLGDLKFAPKNGKALWIREEGQLRVVRSTRIDAALGKAFTVDLWVHPEDLADQPVLRMGDLKIGIVSGRFVAVSGKTSVVGSNAQAGAWQHLALEAKANDISLYVDGARFAAKAATGNIVGIRRGVEVLVGGKLNTGHEYLGMVDNLRLRRGEAYRGAFVPVPTFPNPASAVLAFSFAEVAGALLRSEGKFALVAQLQGRASVVSAVH